MTDDQRPTAEPARCENPCPGSGGTILYGKSYVCGHCGKRGWVVDGKVPIHERADRLLSAAPTAEPEPPPKIDGEVMRWRDGNGTLWAIDKEATPWSYVPLLGRWVTQRCALNTQEVAARLAARVVALEAALKERKPASDEEVMAAWMRTPSWHGDRPDYFIAGWKAAERRLSVRGAEDGHADVAHGREGER